MAFLILVSLLRVVHMNSLLSLWWKHHIFFSLPCYVLKIAFTFCRVCVRFYDDIMRGRRTMTRFCTEHTPIIIIWSFRNWTCFLWVYCIFVATSAIIFRFEFVSSSVQAFSINKKGQKNMKKKARAWRTNKKTFSITVLSGRKMKSERHASNVCKWWNGTSRIIIGFMHYIRQYA